MFDLEKTIQEMLADKLATKKIKPNQVVNIYRPLIEALKDQGFSLKDIVEMMKDKGIIDNSMQYGSIQKAYYRKSHKNQSSNSQEPGNEMGIAVTSPVLSQAVTHDHQREETKPELISSSKSISEQIKEINNRSDLTIAQKRALIKALNAQENETSNNKWRDLVLGKNMTNG